MRLRHRRMLSNAGWLTICRVAGDVLSFALFVVLARHFGPTGIGQYAYGLALAGIVYAAVHLGLEDYAIRQVAAQEGDERDLVDRLMGLQLGAAVIASLALVGFLWATRSAAATALVALCLAGQQVAFALARTLFVPAFARERMAGPALAQFAARTAITGGAVALVFTGASLATAMLAFPVGGLLLLAWARGSARRFVGSVRPRASWSGARRLARAAWPFAGSVLVFYVHARAVIIIVALFLGEHDTGIFASALKFVEVGLVPLSLLAFAAYPHLSRAFPLGDGGMVRAADRVLRVTLAGGAALAWGLVTIVPTVGVVLLGDEFAPAMPLTQLLAGFALVMAANVVLARVLLAANLQIRRLQVQCAGVLTNVILALIFVPLWGLPAAVATTTATVLIIALAYLAVLHRRLATGRLTRTSGIVSAIALLSAVVGFVLAWATSLAWLGAVASLVVLAAWMSLGGLGALGLRLGEPVGGRSREVSGA